MQLNICLPKFDIYQGKIATKCFKSRTNSWYPDFLEKKVLSVVRSEIHLVGRNILSAGHTVRA